MRRPSSSTPAAATAAIPVTDTSRVLATWGPPAGIGRAARATPQPGQRYAAALRADRQDARRQQILETRPGGGLG